MHPFEIRGKTKAKRWNPQILNNLLKMASIEWQENKSHTHVAIGSATVYFLHEELLEVKHFEHDRAQKISALVKVVL